MKKAYVLIVICLLVVMLFSSACRSSRPCSAYRSVSPVTSSVEQPVGADQSS